MGKVNIVIEENYFDNESQNVWCFASEDDAKKFLKNRKELFEKNVKKISDRLEIDESETCYECYIEGSYVECHYYIYISKCEIL